MASKTVNRNHVKRNGVVFPVSLPTALFQSVAHLAKREGQTKSGMARVLFREALAARRKAAREREDD